jgi:hypothetical protein
MSNFNYQFAVDRNIVVAMLNDDWSGLSEADCDHVDDFNMAVIDLHGHCLFTTEISHEPQETQWLRCDVSNLMAECLILTLVNRSK